MNTRIVIWQPIVRSKLIKYRSDRFTPEETFDFISELVLEIEDILSNPVFGRAYTEEHGDYKGISRILIKKFRVYFEQVDNDIVIVAILFPGEK